MKNSARPPGLVPRPLIKIRLGGPQRRRRADGGGSSTARLVEDLRHSQAELEIQNKALRYSQAQAEGASERFVTLFSNVPLALMVVDERGQILENNARTLDLLRPLEDDPPLIYLFPLIRAAHVERVRQGFVRAIESGACELSELEFSAGSNGVLTGDLHIARIDNPQGHDHSFICALIDQGPLLAQRHALQSSAQALQERNEELWKSQARLSAIIDSSLDAIVCVDAQHQITVFNPAAAALFRCSVEEALAQPLSKFLPEADRALGTIGPSRHLLLGEMSGLTMQGDRVPVDVSLSFEQRASGDVVTLFARDLTDSKKLEAHKARLEVQLRESQKMQAIGTMAGGIAHDFNNIISAILGNVTLASQDVASDCSAAISLAEIDKAGRRARDLVRQILTFSRNEPPNRLPLQLADVIHEAVRLLRVTLPPHIQMLVDIDPDTPPVLADATQVEQVLLNLCTNAIHAIGEQSGQIRIELRHSLRNTPGSHERRNGLRGHHARITISDTGCGMDPAIVERIFEPFFTTKPVGQGTGLGLSVVHGIMHAHAGLVEVASRIGQGSSFTVLFPVAETPLALPASTPVQRVSAQGAGQRVMYVDDDEALVFLINRVLKRKGYQVLTFTDPRLAIAALRADPMQIDLLVTDYNMPGYSGVDLLRDVKAVRPGLPVALASGYVTPDIEQAALAAGARALIHKPNDVDELCDTVQRLLLQTKEPD
jgi:two-component system cell cycle sensor histidine kinase/response regulator CckA